MLMGLRLFNNAAIAATTRRGGRRPLSVSRTPSFRRRSRQWNEYLSWDDKTVMYASTHEMLYDPGTGSIGKRWTRSGLALIIASIGKSNNEEENFSPAPRRLSGGS